MAGAKAILNRVHGAVVLRRRVRVLANLLAQELPKAAHVLDVGAGDGLIAGEIARLRPDIAIEGIDILVRPTTRIPVRPFDGVHLPLDDGSVDTVMFVDVLHHTEDPIILLREAARVTRRHVVIEDHLKEGFLAREILRAMDWVGNYGHNVVLPYNYYTLDEWHGLFRDASLKPEQDRKSAALPVPSFPNTGSAAPLRYSPDARSGSVKEIQAAASSVKA